MEKETTSYKINFPLSIHDVPFGKMDFFPFFFPDDSGDVVTNAPALI